MFICFIFILFLFDKICVFCYNTYSLLFGDYMKNNNVTVRFFLVSGCSTEETMCPIKAEKTIGEVSSQISSGCSLYSRIPIIINDED